MSVQTNGEPSVWFISLVFFSMPFVIIIGDKACQAIGRKWKQHRSR